MAYGPGMVQSTEYTVVGFDTYGFVRLSCRAIYDTFFLVPRAGRAAPAAGIPDLNAKAVLVCCSAS
eukprot:7387348-Prymnesium_polylepis.1